MFYNQKTSFMAYNLASITRQKKSNLMQVSLENNIGNKGCIIQRKIDLFAAMI